MKYILLNPSFQKGPIEIDNPQAIRQIEGRLNNLKIILGEQILLCVNNILIELQPITKDNEKIEFKLVSRNKKEGN
jgi:hypothetical protein